MFGMGIWELAIIGLVAVIVFGPERLPEFARQAGRMVRTLRTLADSARDELRKELGPEYADLELRDLDPRALVQKHIIDVVNEADEPTPKLNGTGGARPRHARDPEAPTPFDPDAT